MKVRRGGRRTKPGRPNRRRRSLNGRRRAANRTYETASGGAARLGDAAAAEQRLDEEAAVEDLEVVHALPDADILYRNLELV